jgi:hypothetical protein
MEEIKKLASELANTILYDGNNPLPDSLVKDNAQYLLDLIDGHVEPLEPSIEQLAIESAVQQAKTIKVDERAKELVPVYLKADDPEQLAKEEIDKL